MSSNSRRFPFFPILLFLLIFSSTGSQAWGLASNNIPLDSPVYSYLEKLAGFGLLTSDIRGLKPYSKAEAARLLAEAEDNLHKVDRGAAAFANSIVDRLHELLPREIALRKTPEKAAHFDYNLISAARLRYVYLDGKPRSYNREVFVRGGQSAFGFIGGTLRPDDDAAILTQSGSEGTPLLENNEGVTYSSGNNGELRWSTEAFVTNSISLLAEPIITIEPGVSRFALQKGYVKLGDGGLELEVGRDANWFGPGYRGALTLTNNAANFDLVKLSSPEPLDVAWVKEYLGNVKYALVISRFNETGSGINRRQPYFLGLKLAVKPNDWFEIGGNFVRQEGGPGLDRDPTARDFIFGGGNTNNSNSIAGIDLRFRLPWRNSELYAEYAGEDSAAFWPFVESYVAGFYIPRLTSDGKDDLRFEFFYGHPMLYTDFKFPAGYAYEGMTPGHSQGGSAFEFFTRYSHWFSVRNNVALEYFHTERGREGLVDDQQTEKKNALRAFWTFPVFDRFDIGLMYGWERIIDFNLVGDARQTNHLLKADLSYQY